MPAADQSNRWEVGRWLEVSRRRCACVRAATEATCCSLPYQPALMPSFCFSAAATAAPAVCMPCHAGQAEAPSFDHGVGDPVPNDIQVGRQHRVVRRWNAAAVALMASLCYAQECARRPPPADARPIPLWCRSSQRATTCCWWVLWVGLSKRLLGLNPQQVRPAVLQAGPGCHCSLHHLLPATLLQAAEPWCKLHELFDEASAQGGGQSFFMLLQLWPDQCSLAF